MSKKDSYIILASQLFIERQMSIAAIAKKLSISEKTLFNWKKEEEWDKKRTRYLKSMYSCNQNLYELLNLVTKKALDDFYADGSMPDQKTLYFIMNMASKLKDLKAFEENAAQEKIEEVQETSAQEVQKETADNVLQKVLKALTE